MELEINKEKLKYPCNSDSQFALHNLLVVSILQKYLQEMVTVYEGVSTTDNTGSGDMRKAKLTMYAKILEVQHSIKIINKHQH